MSQSKLQRPQGPVAVLAPSGRDARVLAGALRRVGVEAMECAGIEAFCAALTGDADAGLVAEEALPAPAAARLVECLRGRPAWSDPPVIVLGVAGREAAPGLIAMWPEVNLTVVERPTRPSTLVAAVRAALRARARQHATRAHLEELAQAREALSQHRDELERAVRRTALELDAAGRALRLSERMAAIGTLSAGVGHDIANLLMPIRVHADALAAQGGPGSENVAAIRACVDHLQRLSAGLRQLALDPEDSGGPSARTDLADWAGQAEPVLRNCLPRGVRLDIELPGGLPAPAVAPHQLTQAVFNLVQNAGDAMRARGAGRVRVWADAAQGPPERVRVGVSDDGPGMSAEVRARCLEPLFTTKARQLSTGLGLALVNGVVRRAGGELAIDTEPGRGTTFVMAFPPARAPESRSAPTAIVGVSDLRQRGVAAATLRSMGFAVTLDAPGAAQGAGPEAPRLWVADAGTVTPEAVRRFLDAAPGRRVVVVGPAPAGVEGPGVIAAPEFPGRGLREALVSAGLSSDGPGRQNGAA